MLCTEQLHSHPHSTDNAGVQTAVGIAVLRSRNAASVLQRLTFVMMVAYLGPIARLHLITILYLRNGTTQNECHALICMIVG